MKLETGSNPINQRVRDRGSFHIWCGLYHFLLEVSPRQSLSWEPWEPLVCSQTWKQSSCGKWLQKESRIQRKCTNDLRLCKEKHQTNILTKHSTYQCPQVVFIVLYRVRSVEKKKLCFTFVLEEQWADICLSWCVWNKHIIREVPSPVTMLIGQLLLNQESTGANQEQLGLISTPIGGSICMTLGADW